MLALVAIRIKKVRQAIDKINTLVYNLRQLPNWKSYRKRISNLMLDLTRWEGLLEKLIMTSEYVYRVNGLDSTVTHTTPRGNTVYRLGVNKDYEAIACACGSQTYQHGTVDGKCKHIRTFNSLVHGNLIDIIFSNGDCKPSYHGKNPSKALKESVLKGCEIIIDTYEQEYHDHLELKASLGLW